MRISILLLAGALGLAGCANPLDRLRGIENAVERQRWESTLTAQKEHPRPYSSVEIDVRFTGPGGATFRVPAFWDGDRTFRFRAAFPAAGIWHWRTTCNDATDAGLHDQAGVVRVSSYIGENPLYRHGDLRVSADRRYLVHADGTPFLWLGDTAWRVLRKSTFLEWQEYVDARVQQRFSVIQVVATGTLAPKGGKPPLNYQAPLNDQAPFLQDSTPNSAYWRALEEKLAYANDRGLIVLLTGVGNSAGFGAQQRPPAFLRYLAGRLAAHMVIFSPSMDQRFDQQNDEAGARLHELTTHLVTQHPGTNYEAVIRYHDATYTDFCGVQSGHRNGDLMLAYQGAREWTAEVWQRPPIKPVILLEAMYDAHGNNDALNWREQDVRKLGWIGWLSGARGYTYGAGDVPPKVPAGGGGIWNFQDNPAAYDYWRKAIRWPSAGQMTHLRDFFAGIDWWRLEPAQGLLKNQAEEQTRKMVVSRSAAGDLLVAYMPDNAEIILDLHGMSAGLSGRWYNPVTGVSVSTEGPLLPSASASLRRPAGWSDAVLLLTEPSSRTFLGRGRFKRAGGD